jgi:hypothetical protein
MSDESGSAGSQPQADPQALAKLQGLERMRLAGLIGESEYQSMLAKLLPRVEATPPAPPAPPVSTLTLPAPAVSTAPPPAAAAAPGWASPPPPPSAPAEPGAISLRTTLAFTGIAVALIAATAGGTALISHARNAATPLSAAATSTPYPSATATPTATPNPVLALAPLRTAAPDPNGAVITQIAAEKLVRAMWPVRDLALSHRSPDAVRAVEDGPAGEWDAIGCTMGCAPPSPRSIRDVHLFVPRQTAFPAAFMAQVLTTQYHDTSSLVEIMVFTRQSASAPWFLSFDTSYSGIDRLREFPSIDLASGFEKPPAADRTVERSGLPGMLAAYWQRWADTGAAPPSTRFLDGAFTTRQGQDIAATRTEMRSTGINSKLTYTADPAHDGVWSFAVNTLDSSNRLHADDVLTCGTVRYRDVGTPLTAGGAVVQGMDFMPYGSLLRPGGYSDVTMTGVHESCMLTHPGETPIQVEGINGHQTRVVGVPVSGGASA